MYKKVGVCSPTLEEHNRSLHFFFFDKNTVCSPNIGEHKSSFFILLIWRKTTE